MHHIEKKDNVLYDQYGIDRKKFIVSYAGNLGLLQGIDKLLDVANGLKKYDDIEFVNFGNGVCREELEKKITDENISNAKILPLQPSNLLSETYSFGDVEFVSVKPGVMKMACPHKIFDIFSVGNAILAMIDSDSDVAQLINQQKLGYSMEMNVELLNKTILQMYETKDITASMGQNARKFAETIDYNNQIQLYIERI